MFRNSMLGISLPTLALVALVSACSQPADTPETEPQTSSASSEVSVPAESEKVLIDVTMREGTNMGAALSPDGSQFILALQGTLWSLPAEGGDATMLTTPELDAHEPAWSPDGETIVFYAFAADSFTLWSMKPDGSALTQLTDGSADARYPSYSPDGTSILFASDPVDGYQIWTHDLETGENTKLTTAGQTGYEAPETPYFSGSGNAVYPVLSPDQSQLAFVIDGATDTLVVTDASADAELTTIYSEAIIGAPVWSPDGDSLVVASFTSSDGSGQLVRAFPNGADAEILVDNTDIFSFRPSVAPDGSIYYTADGQIKHLSADGTPMDSVPFAAKVTLDRTPYERRTYDLTDTSEYTALGIVDPSLSPDGSQIVYAALGDLWLADVEADTLTQLTDDVAIDLSPDWSPDGRQIVWASDRGGKPGLWAMDVATGEATSLCDCEMPVNNPVWSPDGTKIAYLSDAMISIFLVGTVNVLDVETGEISVISDQIFGPSGPAWSPDGSRIAVYNRHPKSSRFREGHNAIYLLPADGEGDPIWVTPVEDKSLGRRQFNRPAWSPSGEFVFRMDGALWSAPLTSDGEMGDITKVTDAGENPAWSGDGSSLVFIDGESLSLFDPADASISEVDLKPVWSRPEAYPSLTIRAGKVFDGVSDDYLENVDIQIENGIITSVSPATEAIPEGEFIDASDQIVLPGLMEGHTHEATSIGVSLGELWFSYGITTLRETGDDPYRMVERREAADMERRPWPRVFAAGPLNEGARISYGVSETVGTLEEAEDSLRRHEELGLDLYKSYVRQDYTVQNRVIELAHENGVPVTSHELFPTVANNGDHLEHFGATSRRGFSVVRSEAGYSYQDVISLISESGFVITPTLALMSGGGTRDIGPQKETLKKLVDAGGKIIAGTDSPFIPHGDALHVELEIYVDAGLTPQQALRAATSDLAENLGVGDQLGQVKPGYIADLTILNGDPIDDITNTRKVGMVLKQGQVMFDAEE